MAFSVRWHTWTKSGKHCRTVTQVGGTNHRGGSEAFGQRISARKVSANCARRVALRRLLGCPHVTPGQPRRTQVSRAELTMTESDHGAIIATAAAISFTYPSAAIGTPRPSQAKAQNIEASRSRRQPAATEPQRPLFNFTVSATPACDSLLHIQQ